MSQRTDTKDRIARALVLHAARVAATEQAEWITASPLLRGLPEGDCNSLNRMIRCYQCCPTGGAAFRL